MLRCLVGLSQTSHQPVNQYVYSADAVETCENLSSAKRYQIRNTRATSTRPSLPSCLASLRRSLCVTYRRLTVLQRRCVSRTSTLPGRVARLYCCTGRTPAQCDTGAGEQPIRRYRLQQGVWHRATQQHHDQMWRNFNYRIACTTG